MAELDLDESVLAGLRGKLGDAVVDRLVGLAIDNIEERLAQLNRAIEAGDRNAAAAALHSIKGSAQLLGARRLEDLAAESESRASAGGDPSIETLAADIAAARADVVRALGSG